MPRPSLGPRVPIALRLPLELATRLNARGHQDRHTWIVEAIKERLDREK